jgi:hypothetical protein
MISHAQLETIRKLVDNEISISTLNDDVLDHLCCAVETSMAGGLDFDSAVKTAVKELAPDGLNVLEHETLYLLNTKKTIQMKRLTYIIGFLSAMSMSVGWLLKILKMAEFGNMLFAFGSLGLVLIFLPMLAINYVRASVERRWTEKARVILGILSLILIGIGVLARLMHLPGADELLLGGGVIFTFGFLPFFFLRMYRDSVAGT